MKNAAIAALALFTIPMALANAVTLYEDPETGQVFTKPADGRVEFNYPSDSANTAAKPAASTGTTAKTEDSTAKASKPEVTFTSNTDGNPINNITVLNPGSPEFPLGKETRIGIKFVPQDAPDMWFQAGVRLQGTLERTKTEYANPTFTDTTLNDAYLRRLRLEIGAGFGEHTSFIMDIRNDRVSQFFRDEGEFTVGDAYVKISKPFDTSLVNFKLYRAKINVSRTETVKSAYLISYDRPLVADYAANFISLNRRGANVQMYGNWKNKIHYQIASGDAIQPKAIASVLDLDSDFEITDQTLFYGGKIVFSPFNGWEEIKLTETYMGQGKHFSFGAAYWTVPEIKGDYIDTNSDAKAFDLNHQMINLTASGHYKGLFIGAEWFKFKDVVEDWNAPALNVGDSDGWYVLSEYVMPNFHYIAPFARYETWDRFNGSPDTNITSLLLGVNWYLRGNTTKVGLVYQKTKQDELLFANEDDLFSASDTQQIRITSQFFF